MCSTVATGSLDGGGAPSRSTSGGTEVKMRRFTLPNLFLTVEGQDRELQEICPGIYEYTGHSQSTRSPKSPRSPRSPKSPRSVKSTSPLSPRGTHCHCHCSRLAKQDFEQGSSTASSPSPRRKRPPYTHILLSDRKPSAGNLLATTFGIADRDAPTQSLPLIHEKEKEHARLVVERPEMRDPQAGFEAMGGRCESCGTCADESCLKKLGLEHEDGSRSPSSVSPKSEKMYTFFEKSLSLVSSSPTRLGDHLSPREKRSHSLATPAAMANVAHFQELHSRHAENHLVRTVNLAASNAVLSRISARLRAVTSTTQQESVEEVDEEVEKLAAQNTELIDAILKTSPEDLHSAEDKDKTDTSTAARATPRATQEGLKVLTPDGLKTSLTHDEDQKDLSADEAEKKTLPPGAAETLCSDTADKTTPPTSDAANKTSSTSDAANKTSSTSDAANKTSSTSDAADKTSLATNTAAAAAAAATSILNLCRGVGGVTLNQEATQMVGNRRRSGCDTQGSADTVASSQ